MTPLIPALMLALPSTAQAFCGTYVGEAGATITNSTSQVLIARHEQRTTLTLVNDFGGDRANFALVIPVPQVLGEDDVRTVIPELVQEAERYSGPRLVEYSCDDFYGGDSGGWWDDTGSTADSAFEDTGDVQVEAEFEAGEYSLVVLSAQQSSSLLSWLDGNGYAVSEQASGLLQEYIDAGSYFLAARVRSADLADEATALSPLQIGYDSEAMSLPIRLGTVNSAGVQDLLVYAVNSYRQGQLHIANYPEATLADECMAPIDDFGAFYGERLDQLLPTTGDAHWLLEYGWSPASCDPCPPGGALPDWVITESGYAGEPSDAYLTRLRLRYTPEQAGQDLVFSSSNITSNSQVRFIRHDHDLEQVLPLCDLENNTTFMSEDPGDCEGWEPWDTDPTSDSDPEVQRRDKTEWNGCSCSSPGTGGGAAAMFGAVLLGLLRRRGS